ncbi:hypothetical protein T440DRAFT_446812 [Plenodomus tracheiphilus IPT5]|uniref:Asteroid domain-containing protein n=1 Tax=Plenodomus tracheiphilus IPT5 TaxID=1408161 RepID=A0A6A7BA01_9PLEO|nr:hypothetical protein T440DRAFT_446812 [Plenodomus tracheiphilus IPT5]
MGIPGLARRLEPYAAQYSPDQLAGYCAIIDGPALAYFGHKLAVAAATDASRLPSYRDITFEAIRWLDHLESINVKVQQRPRVDLWNGCEYHPTDYVLPIRTTMDTVACKCRRGGSKGFPGMFDISLLSLLMSTIFFDGALPQAKQLERVSRLEQNNKRVLQLRASYPTESCPIPRTLSSILYAFLAPALREALAASPYAARTRIVPGEADDWCALYAKDVHRSIVFTSDTDLVLYDYPKESLIVFLHGVDLSSGIRGYNPYQMQEKLQLKSLAPFAYALRQNPQDTANLLIQNARSVDMSSIGYVDFSSRYTPSTSISADRRKPSLDSPKLQGLDVRISEYVNQALSSSIRPLVYLPLLVEDPGQASAWNIGHDVRKLAYSLMATEGTVIHEYKRKSQGVSAQEIQTDTMTETETAATDMEQQISGLTLWAAGKGLEAGLLWPLFGLSLVLVELKTPPTIALVLRVLNADFDNTWTFIQLTARLQAAMYSLRMLKQVVGVKLALTTTDKPNLHGSLVSINKHMELFPSIGEMFTVPGQVRKVLADYDGLRAMVEEIYASAGAEVPSEQVSNKKKKRQAREADRKKRKAGMRQMSGL